MKSFIEGNIVCLVNDDFDCLATSNAVFCDNRGDLAKALVLSNSILAPGSSKYECWMYQEDFKDTPTIVFPDTKKVLKVTLEWVDNPNTTNTMIQNSYNYIMDQIAPKESKYEATLYGEEVDINNTKMVIVAAYNLGRQQALDSLEKNGN